MKETEGAVDNMVERNIDKERAMGRSGKERR